MFIIFAEKQCILYKIPIPQIAYNVCVDIIYVSSFRAILMINIWLIYLIKHNVIINISILPTVALG